VGLLPIWGVMAAYRTAQTLILVAIWRSRVWARIVI
jgi:hypothetical protein